jgi:hypothetical protein
VTERDRLNAEAARFFRFSTTCAVYHPPVAITRSRAGRVVTTDAPVPKPVKVDVIPNFNPTIEEITAFGDPSSFKPGKQAILKVLTRDLIPDRAGSFEIGPQRYSIMAITPLYRGARVFRHDVLVGWE